MHSCVYICIFLICTRFFFIIIKSSCYRVWNLNINFIHIIFLVFFFKICICMSSYLLTKSALFCIDFRSTAVCMQCVRTKSYRWTTFLFSFKSNPRWNKLTSASAGLLIWSGSTTLVSCFSNRKHSMNSLKLNQSEETCLPVHICLWPCCVGKR